MGIDENGYAYIEDPNSSTSYIKVPNGMTQYNSGFKTTHEDYAVLADKTGGETWDITLIKSKMHIIMATAMLDALFEDSRRIEICCKCVCIEGEMKCETIKDFDKIPQCVGKLNELSVVKLG